MYTGKVHKRIFEKILNSFFTTKMSAGHPVADKMYIFISGYEKDTDSSIDI